MANSPSCSSTSPTASTATNATDLQEADAFSDDSGVDVKPQIGRYLQFSGDSAAESQRRNKRKSSEPKKRKDVLLMKRFRWDSDEEDRDVEDNDDVFDVLERERPSSGDSGCQLDSTARPPSQEKKKKQRQWRKPKTETIQEEEDLSHPPFRQSVICKNEATTIAPPTCTGASTTLHYQDTTTPSVSPLAKSIVKKSPTNQSNASPGSSRNYDPVLDDDDSRSSRGASTLGGRPRNYKSMSRQRRIEANARERTRVHTISAAFESLRRAVPAYAHNQKLSKLAILRIASAYIVALACLNDQPEGPTQPPPSLAECVERCTRTIQAEGRSRRRTSKD